MSAEYPVRTSDQLPSLIQAFRKQTGMTQVDVALRMGMSQQTYSALERTADRVSAGRLVKLFSVLGVEMVLRARGSDMSDVDFVRGGTKLSNPTW